VEFSPITVEEFAKKYHELYGFKENSITSYAVSEFVGYYQDGKFDLTTPILPTDIINKLKSLFNKDFYFKEDVLKLRDYLYEVTGERTWAYRFPGGSSNSVAKISIHECIDFLKEEGIVHFDWNASSEDAVSTGVSCSVLNSNVLKDALRFQQPVILMHDLHECNNTAEGLEALIDQLKEEGYEICPIEKDTRPVQHVK
jgi:peptidoglycan/xylan/chitin deacetylase (PgdA/CDA1 family)